MSTVLNLKGEKVAALPALLADDAALPATGTALVSLARWQAEAAALSARGEVTVLLPNTADVLGLDAALLALPRLVLQFPGFADGRAYSQARRLRDRCGYRGALRATGAAVVLDQLAMMARSGLDEFELREDQSLERCRAALQRQVVLPYQPAHDRTAAVFASRRA